MKKAALNASAYEQRNVLKLLAAMCFLWFLSLPTYLFAYVMPAPGSFGYTVYDLLINNVASGAPGTTFGVGAMLYAAVKCLGPDIPRVIGGIAAGGLFLKGQDLATSLGRLI